MCLGTYKAAWHGFRARHRLHAGQVIAIYLGLAVWGYWALLRTPIDAIPDLSENQVVVFTDWTGRVPNPSQIVAANSSFPIIERR